MNKKKAQIKHAIKRAHQRYDSFLSKEDIVRIVSDIQNNKNKFLYKESNRLSHWLIVYKDKIYHGIYDNKRKTIVTFLTINEKLSFEELYEKLTVKLENKHFIENNWDSLNKELEEIWSISD